MYHKKIEGERLYLSPMTLDDIPKYVKWLNDRKVTDGIHATFRMTNELTEKAWVEKIMEKGDYTFGIVKKENNELIGNCGLMNYSPIDGKCTIGIFIGDEENRGRGYGKEAINMLLEYGFNVLRCHNINLDVFDFNEQAIACYKKIGFKEYGRRHECYYLDGKWHDELSMEILETDYRNRG